MADPVTVEIIAESSDGHISSEGATLQLADAGTIFTVITTTTWSFWAGKNWKAATNNYEAMRSYLAFDLSSIPAEATITAAVLKVYVDQAFYNPAELELDLVAQRLTWAPPLTSDDWGLPPSSYPPVLYSALNLATLASGFLSINYLMMDSRLVPVPGEVNYYRLAPLLSYSGTQPQPLYIRFVSSDAPETAKRPRLVVTYVPPLSLADAEAFFAAEGVLNVTRVPPAPVVLNARFTAEGMLGATLGAIEPLIEDAGFEAEGQLGAALAMPALHGVAYFAAEGVLWAMVGVANGAEASFVGEGMLRVVPRFALPGTPLLFRAEGMLKAGSRSIVETDKWRTGTFRACSTVAATPSLITQRVLLYPLEMRLVFSSELTSFSKWKGLMPLTTTLRFTTTLTAFYVLRDVLVTATVTIEAETTP